MANTPLAYLQDHSVIEHAGGLVTELPWRHDRTGFVRLEGPACVWGWLFRVTSGWGFRTDGWSGECIVTPVPGVCLSTGLGVAHDEALELLDMARDGSLRTAWTGQETLEDEQGGLWVITTHLHDLSL